MWNLQKEETNYGYARRALRGHNHFVSDIVISSDGQFALSGADVRIINKNDEVVNHRLFSLI